MQFSDREKVLLERLFFSKFLTLSGDYKQAITANRFNSASNILSIWQEYMDLAVKLGLDTNGIIQEVGNIVGEQKAEK